MNRLFGFLFRSGAQRQEKFEVRYSCSHLDRKIYHTLPEAEKEFNRLNEKCSIWNITHIPKIIKSKTSDLKITHH